MNIQAENTSNLPVNRSRALTGILDQAIAALELTPEQRKSVGETYWECGEYLTHALGLKQGLGDIFSQGSMRLGTVIRPYRDITEVFDLDVVFRVAVLRDLGGAETFRNSVGQHLKVKYNGTVKPLTKGWRLDFSKERDYYLDIIPAKDSDRGGSVIAITDDASWKNSNPRGYATEFERVAAIEPKFEELAMFSANEAMAKNAHIEPLPEHTHFKSPLHRITQISKRYRDYYFNKKTKTSSLTPPSIVLTTLLMAAYERAASTRTYSSGFDLLLACVEALPKHIERRWNTLTSRYDHWLANPSLPDENLVEKWKDDRYAKAFDSWHADYVDFLHQLLNGGSARPLLTEAFGSTAINSAFAKQGQSFADAREQNKLIAEPKYGLAIGSGSAGLVSSSHVIHGV